MKILHISGAKGWGGNEQQMMNIIPELNALGIKNSVFGVPDSVLQKECDALKIHFIDCKSHKLNKFVNYRYLKTIVKQLQPDIIHMHTSDSLTVFTIADLLFGLNVKAIFSKKGMGVSSSFLSKLKYNYSGIQSIICVSKSVQIDFSNILSNKNKPKTVVIHDCVSFDIINQKSEFNLKEKLSIEPNQLLVGNIANHSGAKDIETLINVVDYFVNQLNRNDVIFVQIGEFSKLTDGFLKLIEEKKLTQHILFTNKLPRAFTLIPQFNIFIMTSQREGGPSSVLESMLLGVPIVSTNVGVIPDVIEDGKNGFISPIKDYQDLANKTNTLLENKALQNQFSELSKDSIFKEFSAHFIANQTASLYQKVITL